MSVVAIIQARMNSSRLPGKVLLPLPTGRSVLREVINAAKQVKGVDQVVVATTTSPYDEILIPHISAETVPTWRGSERDVLRRYYEAAKAHKARAVMRITADCPLIDPGICSGVLATFLRNSGRLDYVSNTLPRTYPKGLDCEVFSFELLETAHKLAVKDEYREHVTLWMLESWYRPNVRLENYAGDRDYSETDWSLDTLEDYHRIWSVMRQQISDRRKRTQVPAEAPA
jgi:spore coat polysaccharide biosynthesis protein SpsF